jgi:periplasmic protein TonB
MPPRAGAADYMPQPLDILDQRDPLAGSFVGALAIHVCAIALLFFGWYWANRPKEMLGDPHPAGGPAYSVSPVHNIPIPKRDAPLNPVANDTQSTVPTAPAKQEVEKPPPPPQKDAFELPEKIKRETPRPQQQRRYTEPAPPNQVYSRSPQAVSNPMYGMQSGAGQVGIGPNSPLGYRLGAYAEIIRQRIAEKWQTNGLDARSQTTPAAVSFDISRDGSIHNPKIVQSSGNPTIDNTALRAVYDAGPLPQLPPQITESSISAQFTFNLR